VTRDILSTRDINDSGHDILASTLQAGSSCHKWSAIFGPARDILEATVTALLVYSSPLCVRDKSYFIIIIRCVCVILMILYSILNYKRS
jgi:hypothetical protein